MLVNIYILNIVIPKVDIIGDTLYHYIFYFLWFGLLIFFFIRYQSRSLIEARKLLKEKDLAYDEIERQREELEYKNKNITDSMIYASYIQQALLPSEIYFKKIFRESFIYYNPKEIVSGDFYWISENSTKVFVVAADCTGHGVPGAFMSMIGVELLNKVIIDQKVEKPSEILTILSKGIDRTFSRTEFGGKTMKDGMDIGLCMIDRNNKKLEYAGAFFPLYVIRDNKLTEIKGDRLSVGLMTDDLFTNNNFNLMDDDIIYLFSDGYTDQFGGPNDKKFMYRRFRHLLLSIHHFPMEEQMIILKDSIASWQLDNEQVDDQMVIGIRPFPGNLSNLK
ncbi:MAG: SpoIIE family protein phosphatase [Bacteroidales bacterium]|nr:SpoIIE family protein phosphatase [Bacteroidales bacterium]